MLLIDSEAIEGALIKGYWSRKDLCEVIPVFCDLAFDLKVRVFIDRISTDPIRLIDHHATRWL